MGTAIRHRQVETDTRIARAAVLAMTFLLASAMPQAWSETVSETVADTEIEYLIQSVAQSGCEFIRNGKRHAADDAADHLRLKYRNGSKYVSNADEFIDRLASKSSWTGRAYTIDCPGEPAVESGIWLRQKLAFRRQSQSS